MRNWKSWMRPNPCDKAIRGVDDMRSEAQNDICLDGWTIRFR